MSDRDHRSIYYLSRVLQGAEKNYLEIEKFALSLVSTARRLRPYFQSHPIVVLTDQPLKQVLSQPNVSGRLTKWAIELGEFELNYRPRTAIKAQVLADFLTERIDLPEDIDQDSGICTLHVDGSATSTGGGAGITLRSPAGEEFDLALQLNFKVTNNEAEYEALIAGLKLAREMGVSGLAVFVDSQLVVSQMDGTFEAKEQTMIKYLEVANVMKEDFKSFSFSSHFP